MPYHHLFPRSVNTVWVSGVLCHSVCVESCWLDGWPVDNCSISHLLPRPLTLRKRYIQPHTTHLYTISHCCHRPRIHSQPTVELWLLWGLLKSKEMDYGSFLILPHWVRLVCPQCPNLWCHVCTGYAVFYSAGLCHGVRVSMGWKAGWTGALGPVGRTSSQTEGSFVGKCSM